MVDVLDDEGRCMAMHGANGVQEAERLHDLWICGFEGANLVA